MGEVRQFPVAGAPTTKARKTMLLADAASEVIAATAEVARIPQTHATCPGCGVVYAADRVEYVWKGHRGKRVCVKCWSTALIAETTATIASAMSYDAWLAETDDE